MATKAKEDMRKFILECIEVYHSLPALWNVKSGDYSNRTKKKNEKYEHLLRKYRERFLIADKNQMIKKFNSLHTNFRKELTGADDVVKPTLWYFEEMRFLIGQEEPCTLLNTIQIGEEEDRNLRRWKMLAILQQLIQAV